MIGSHAILKLASQAGIKPTYITHAKTRHVYKLVGVCKIKTVHGEWVNGVRYVPVNASGSGAVYVRPSDMFMNFDLCLRPIR